MNLPVLGISEHVLVHKGVKDMIDGILDLLIAILVLAIVLGFAFGLILPLVDNDMMKYDESITDKAVLETIKEYDDFAIGNQVPLQPTMTAQEIILMTQVQDTNMPKPRAYKIGADVLEVTSTYKLVVREIGIELWGKLPNLAGNYTIEYDFDTVEGFKIEEE